MDLINMESCESDSNVQYAYLGKCSLAGRVIISTDAHTAHARLPVPSNRNNSPKAVTRKQTRKAQDCNVLNLVTLRIHWSSPHIENINA